MFYYIVDYAASPWTSPAPCTGSARGRLHVVQRTRLHVMFCDPNGRLSASALPDFVREISSQVYENKPKEDIDP